MNDRLLDAENLLLQKLNSGEEIAFDYFFHRYFPLLTAYSKQLISDEEGVEELVQDVFYKVWQKREDFSDIRALKAFLYVATKNASFNALSKRQNRQKHQDAYAEMDEQMQQSALQEIVRAEVYASLSAAIRSLPGQCSKIIQMLFEEDMKPAEIAEELGISVSTVNSQKARGLTLLKERLEDKNLDFLLLVGLYLWFR